MVRTQGQNGFLYIFYVFIQDTHNKRRGPGQARLLHTKKQKKVHKSRHPTPLCLSWVCWICTRTDQKRTRQDHKKGRREETLSVRTSWTVKKWFFSSCLLASSKLCVPWDVTFFQRVQDEDRRESQFSTFRFFILFLAGEMMMMTIVLDELGAATTKMLCIFCHITRRTCYKVK